MMTEVEQKQAISIIGANIEIYNHFSIDAVPYEDGTSIVSCKDVTKEEFLQLLYDYYNSNRLNYGYYQEYEVRECSSTKRFIKNRIKDTSYEVGLEWLNNNEFKVKEK